MTWFKVDDGFWSHPKTAMLSDAAVTLWVRAGAYSCQHLTDGVIARPVLRLVGTEDAAAELVDAGLWLVHPAGWEFHDWSDYQPTKADVEADRAAARERMRERRRNKRGKFEGSSPEHPANVREKFENRSSTPTRPDPTTTSNEVVDPPTPQGGKRSKSRGSRLAEDWMPSAELIAQMRVECPDVDLQAEHRIFVDYWIAQPGQKGVKLDWPATWRNWMRRKQGDAAKRSQRTFGQMRQDNALSLVEKYRQEEARAEVGSGDAADVRALATGR
ncbi:hypothetical protein [Nesterenkonia sp.]|uniref:hypothetical protein n=1 Tax=Nesterenkonia sp. TaxID=704201 RepID=UPI002631EA69|nr:hypothetical protein [Nesterenkonia sp.]